MLSTGGHSVRPQDSSFPLSPVAGIWEQMFIQTEQKKERNNKFISSRRSTHTVMINMHLSGALFFLLLKLVLLKSHPSSKSSNCTTACDHLIICVFFSRWYLEKTPYILENIFTLKRNAPNGFLLEKTIFSLSTLAKSKLIKSRTFSVLQLRSYPGRLCNYKFLLQLKVHRTNLQQLTYKFLVISSYVLGTWNICISDFTGVALTREIYPYSVSTG